MCSKGKQIRFFRHNWAFIQMLRFTVLISCLNRFCWVIIMVLFRHFCSVTGSVTSRKFWNKKPLKRSYYLIYWSQSLSQMHRATFRFVVVSFAQTYRKIPKISPGLIFCKSPWGAYVRRKICVSKSIELARGGKEFCFVSLWIWGQIPSTSLPRGAYIQSGDLTEGFLLYEFVGLIFEGVKGLFSQFYGISGSSSNAPPQFKKMGRSVGWRP